MTDENKDIEPETSSPQQDPAQDSEETAPKAAAPKKAPAKKATTKASAKDEGDAAEKPAKKAPAKKKTTAAKSDDEAAQAENKPAKKPAAKKAPAKKKADAEGDAAATKDEAAKADAPKAAPAPRPRRSRREKPAEAITVRAQAKFVRSSARKARLVCDHIRDTPVEKARTILSHSPRAVARDWSKLLESAVANAEHNHALDAEDLHVIAVYADEGPTLKRFQPRAQGRAFRIRKRTSHLTILLGSKE